MHSLSKWLSIRLANGWFWRILMSLLIGLGLVVLDELIEVIVLGPDHAAANSNAGRLWLEVALFAVIGFFAVYLVVDRQRRSERLRWLTRAVEQSVNMVIITDLEGRVEYVNPKFTEVTGYTLDDVMGKSPRFLDSMQSSHEEYVRLWYRLARDGELRSELLNYKKNGEPYWESVLVSPLFNSDGVITHYLSIKEDITARKVAEQTERIQRAWSDALSEMATVLNMTLDTSTIVDRILTFVGIVMPSASAEIMLIGNDGLVRVERMVGAMPAETQAHLKSLRLAIDDLPNLRKMYDTCQPVVVPDIAQSPDWVNLGHGDWLRSYIGAPICREGEVFGFIGLHSQEPGFFNETHLDRLQTFATHAAIAISNARLLDSEREQRILAEELHAAAVVFNSTLDLDAVLDHVLASVERLLPHEAAFILLIENEQGHIARSRGLEPEELAHFERQGGLSETSLRNLQRTAEIQAPIVIADLGQDERIVRDYGLPRLRSFLGVPIVISDQLIGLLGVHAAQPGQFTERDAVRVQMFADQAALAIHNAQSHAAVQRHASDLGVLVRQRTTEIARQRSHLQAILDSIGEGVAHVRQGQIVYTNRALRRMFGYVESELPDRLNNLDDFDLEGSTVFADFVRNAEVQLLTGHVWRTVLQVRHKDGSPFDVALTVSRTGTSADDLAAGIVLIMRDVSQEKALQEQKDRFLTHAAHELRTPISNIKTRLYLLRQQPDQPERHLAVIDEVAQTMQNLVEDMLDLVRMERHSVSLRRQVVNLGQILTESVARQAEIAGQKGVTLELDLSDPDLTTCADYGRLQQAFDRLLASAIYHASGQPRVVVSLRRDQVGSMPYALASVWYAGDTLAEDQVPHVFDPFFHANEADAQGVGLGLTLAQQIIGLHQGEIWLEPAQEGMRFMVRLTLDHDCSQYLSLGSAMMGNL